MSTSLTASETRGASVTSLPSFLGLRLREPIPFDLRRLRDGHTLANIDVTEEAMADAEEAYVTANDSHATMPIGFRANFGSGRGFYFAHGPAGARTYKKAIPSWALNETSIQKLLLRCFPKLKTDKKQREDAARWALVIHWYYRVGYTHSQIAHEIGSSDCKVRGVIRSIQRVSRGLRANGKGTRTDNRGANLRGTQHPRKSRS